MVRSFCTALKPPASPAARRQSDGHAAYGRSRPPGDIQTGRWRGTHEISGPSVWLTTPDVEGGAVSDASRPASFFHAQRLDVAPQCVAVDEIASASQAEQVPR